MVVGEARRRSINGPYSVAWMQTPIRAGALPFREIFWASARV